jgi:hypothetical protein
MYDFFVKIFFLSNRHYMKETSVISLKKTKFLDFPSVHVIQCPKFDPREPNFGQ